MFEPLRAKTSIPPARPKRLERPHLLERVASGVQRALTLVVAPAGFGKTSLLAAWAGAAPLPVAWLSLDAADRAPERFLGYLIHALRGIDPRAGATAAALLRGGATTSGEGVLYALANDLAAIPGEFALVLDDYHAAESPQVAGIVRFLLESRPANFHLLVASRAMPDLNLARLRGRDQVTEIGALDLRFSPLEVRAFLEGVMDLRLDARDLGRLERSTEGWAVGLQLAAIALARRPVAWSAPAGQAQVFEYLAEEVLQRESPQVQEFLVRSSLLERFSAPLCRVLFEQGAPVEELLAYVERANLFLVPLDARGDWYRYHSLFADFLRARMQRTHPEQAPALYRAASLWCRERGALEDAIQYAARAGDFERAADMIEIVYLDLLQRGEQAAISAWLAQLPAEMVQARPRLLLARGWASIIAVQAEQAWDCARGAAALIPPGAQGDRLRGEAGALRILAGIFLGRPADAGEIARAFGLLAGEDAFLHSLLHLNLGLNGVLTGETRRAVEAFDEAVRLATRLEDPLVAIIALTQLGEVRQVRGELALAERAFQSAMRYTRENLGENSVLLGLPYVSYAELLREQNRFEEALRYGEQGVEHCRVWQPMAGMDGYLALARLEAGRRDWPAAERYFEQALQTAEGTSTYLDDTFVQLFRARACLLGRDLARAEQWLQAIREQKGEASYHFREMIALVRARARVLRGEDASAELAALLPGIERRERVTPLIEALLLTVYDRSRAGEADAARRALDRALELGARGGYVRVFADEGAALLALIEGCREALSAPAGYLDSLLEVMRAEAGRTPEPPAAAEALVPLTRRELEVLRLLADGRSNQEIADELVLALTTVKKHVANILGKLGVANRTQAAMEARRLGWLD